VRETIGAEVYEGVGDLMFGRSRSAKDLVRMSGHLLYEFTELRRLTDLMTMRQRHQVEQNILLDSFVIHMRNLIDFFHGKDFGGKALVLKDYMFQDRSIRKQRPRKTETLSAADAKANVQVAHISFERMRLDDEGSKSWNVTAIYKDIEHLMLWFWNHVDRGTLDSSIWKDEVFDMSAASGAAHAIGNATTMMPDAPSVTFPRRNRPDQSG
jgi:hypothetical protein